MDVAQGAVITNNKDVVCERPLGRFFFASMTEHATIALKSVL